jgi:hypothetical protein
MRVKKRETNINLLARGLEQVVVEDKPLPIKEKRVEKPTDEMPIVLHEAQEVKPREKMKRGPKKNGLIDTKRLLTT